MRSARSFRLSRHLPELGRANVGMALAAALALTIFAFVTQSGGWRSSTGFAAPTFVPGASNNTCSDFQPAGQSWIELKVDPPQNGVFTDGTLTVTITGFDGKSFNWSSNIGVDAVYVKAGSGGSHLYVYSPEATSGTGLTSPGTTGNAISHISFCYDVEPATSTPTRTSTGTPANTSTNTPVNTPTHTPTSTATPVDTATNTPSSTATPEDTATNTPTSTSTPEDTATSTPTSTSTPENTATSTPTNTSTPEDTATSTPTSTSTPEDTATNTPTSTSTPEDTATNTPTSTNTNTPAATNTPDDDDEPNRTRTPTRTATAEAETSAPTNTPIIAVAGVRTPAAPVVLPSQLPATGQHDGDAPAGWVMGALSFASALALAMAAWTMRRRAR